MSIFVPNYVVFVQNYVHYYYVVNFYVKPYIRLFHFNKITVYCNGGSHATNLSQGMERKGKEIIMLFHCQRGLLVPQVLKEFQLLLPVSAAIKVEVA